jgi:ssDNA-binding Zn-finger/Zn-ribbon topoisomerase 1
MPTDGGQSSRRQEQVMTLYRMPDMFDEDNDAIYDGRIRVKPEPYCPDCGGKMVLRCPKPYQNWEPFWGCSQYPDCKGSRNIKRDGTPSYPERGD